MAKNSKKTLSPTIPLLPRSAWNSQVTYLKVILKAKQALDGAPADKLGDSCLTKT